MLKKLLILSGIVLFLSCGGGSSKEAKELLQKILTVIGIPPSIITNICQTSNQSDICEGMTLHKSSNKKTKPWQKITQTEIGQYLLETNIPCEPILLELKDGEVVDDDGEFFLKFSGVELGVKEKELSILEAMVDASYLTSSSVSAIKSLHSVETQNSFYATLYQDLKTNINTLSTRGLTKTQAIRGTLKEMAEELSSYGVESSLPAKLNSCNNDNTCVESELTELSSKLVIYASETDTIVEAQKDNDSPLKVREVSCKEKSASASLKNGLVAYYKFDNGFINSVNDINESFKWEDSQDVNIKDGYLKLINNYDYDPRRATTITIDTKKDSKLVIEKRSKVIVQGNYSLSQVVFLDGKKNMLYVNYNYYHYSGTNDSGQYTNREHFYIQNILLDNSDNLLSYTTSNLIDTRFNQWIRERITLDFINRTMLYEIQNDDGSNFERLQIDNITFNRGEKTQISLRSWDWADGSEHIIDYLKIYKY